MLSFSIQFCKFSAYVFSILLPDSRCISPELTDGIGSWAEQKNKVLTGPELENNLLWSRDLHWSEPSSVSLSPINVTFKCLSFSWLGWVAFDSAFFWECLALLRVIACERIFWFPCLPDFRRPLNKSRPGTASLLSQFSGASTHILQALFEKRGELILFQLSKEKMPLSIQNTAYGALTMLVHFPYSLQ